MTLLCRPPGRGNWHIVAIVIDSWPLDLFALRVGDRITIGARTLRIAGIQP